MSTNRGGVTIPIFPCSSIDEQLEFYEALGFEVTYRQAKPNLYACVRHRIAELHFFVHKQLDPANSFSMCYIHVPDVDTLYREFRDHLKKAYNKIPVKGLPRLTKLNNLAEDRRFNLVDPAGNRLMIGQKHPASHPVQNQDGFEGRPSKFITAYNTAYKLAYAKDDPTAAARVLDLVLPIAEEAAAILRYKAFVLRADIAASMDEADLANTYIDAADHLSLSGQELESVLEETGRLGELKATLGQS